MKTRPSSEGRVFYCLFSCLLGSALAGGLLGCFFCGSGFFRLLGGALAGGLLGCFLGGGQNDLFLQHEAGAGGMYSSM